MEYQTHPTRTPLRYNIVIGIRHQITSLSPPSPQSILFEFTSQDFDIYVNHDQHPIRSPHPSTKRELQSPVMHLQPYSDHETANVWQSHAHEALLHLGLDNNIRNYVMQALQTKVDSILTDIVDKDVMVRLTVDIRRISEIQVYNPAELLTSTEPKIHSLEKVEAKELMLLHDEEKICAICLDDYEKKSCAVRLPCNGKHMFHEGCIDTWLNKSDLCPLCRSSCLKLV